MSFKNAVFCFWALLACPLAFGEDIRSAVVGEVHLASDAAFEKTVEITLEEAAAVYLEDTRFLKGLRLELHLTNLLKKHFDSFGLAIYKGLTPEPRTGLKAFRGTRVFFQYLPYLNRIYIIIPLASEEAAEEPLPVGTYRLAKPLTGEEFPILVVILPIMKGIPDSVAESKFFITVKPILEKEGILDLVLRYPAGMENEPVTLYLDDRELEAAAGKREVAAGLHRLRAESPSFKEVSATFTIESGKSSTVEIILEKLASLLTIEAPQSAEVFLDGEKLADFAMVRYPIEEGSHQVRIKIADYSISKKFTVQKGKDYHLSIVFDIIITED